MIGANVQFVCYRPSPVQALSPLARAVLRTLIDARGYLRTRGMAVETILAITPSRVVASRRLLQPSRGALREALGELEGKGLAEERDGLWRKI